MGRKSKIKQKAGAVAVDQNNYSKLRLIADMKKDSIASINTVSKDKFDTLVA